MIMRYVQPDGSQKEFELRQSSVTIGRGAENDVVITDKRVSRIHCGISYKDGHYFLRDCNSRNGTLVNGRLVDACQLNAGDRIQLGDMVIKLEAFQRKGAITVMRELKDEMAEGKGYHTILQEIIRNEDGTSKQ